MLKRFTSILAALIIGFVATYGMIQPISTALAAEQTTAQEQQQQQPEDPKKDAGGHSGHHG